MYLEVVRLGSSAFIPIQRAHFIIYFNKVYKKYCHSLNIQMNQNWGMIAMARNDNLGMNSKWCHHSFWSNEMQNWLNAQFVY
jgi:hypothetical protein